MPKVSQNFNSTTTTSFVLLHFVVLSMFQPSANTNPPKWMADLENDDINLLQGMLFHFGDGVGYLSHFTTKLSSRFPNRSDHQTQARLAAIGARYS